MGKPNYSFQKHQKELARKKKKEEKRMIRLSKNNPESKEDSDEFRNDEECTDRIESV